LRPRALVLESFYLSALTIDKRFDSPSLRFRSCASFHSDTAITRRPNGLELSGPAKALSQYRAAVAGSVGDPGVLPGLQRVVSLLT